MFMCVPAQPVPTMIHESDMLDVKTLLEGRAQFYLAVTNLKTTMR